LFPDLVTELRDTLLGRNFESDAVRACLEELLNSKTLRQDREIVEKFSDWFIHYVVEQ
jgi:hypothetical protein